MCTGCVCIHMRVNIMQDRYKCTSFAFSEYRQQLLTHGAADERPNAQHPLRNIEDHHA